MIPMRRISAIVLMALLSFPLISTAFLASDADSKLPACCRRAGQHHCAMTASQSESSGPTVQAGKCPSFPTGKAIPANRTISLTGISLAVFAGLVSHPTFGPQTEALCRISYSRAGQKRGPPTSLA